MHSSGSSTSLSFSVKMTRPDLQNVYPRKRLFTRISQHISQSAVWICGPAGCGKTTLVNSYLKEENLPCLWYDVDERDADISSFFYSLGRAAQQLALDKRESFPLLTREYFRGLDVFTRNYFNLLCQSLASPFALVLDSFQEAGEDSITNDILGHAIDILILNNIYFFICSRTHPPQHLIRERARGRLEVMGWNQLKLNCEETEKIICCTTGKAFPESAVQDLYQKTDGWISGLLLLLKTGNSEDISPHMLSLKTPEEIFDYIGTMIFKDLSNECQHMLMNLSYLGRISKNSLKKYNNKQTKALLDRLVRKNAFTYKSITDPVEYFFHPLFLEFLQKQARQTLSPLAHRALLNKSAALLEEEGKKEDAVNLCIKAENFSKAADLVLELAPRLFDQFRIMTLEKWITALPDQIHQKTPWLLFWRGACQMPFSPESAGPFFKKALAGFEKNHIPEGCFMAVSGILDSITYQFNVFQEIDPWLDKYNELENRFGETKQIDVQLKLTISMLNALVHRSPESHAMEKWTQKGWQLLLQIKDVNSTFQIFVPIIILKIMQGDHPAAAHLIHMFDRVSEEKTAPLPFLMLQELKSFHFWLTGEFEKGLAAARYGMAMEKKTGIYLIFSGLRIQGAASAMGLQKYDLAEEFLSQITPLLNRQGLWQQGLYHFICAWYHVLGHNLPKARFHALSCLEKGKATGNRMILSICHLMAAKIQFAFEERESSDQHIEKALSLAYTYKMTQTRFMALLARAFFLFSETRDKDRDKDRDRDRDKEAVNALAQAMTMGRQWNYKYGFTWDNREMIFLCTRALKQNIEVPYVQTLIRDTGLIPDTPPLDIHTWPWMCEITTLGTFTINVQGKPLIFSKKSRQRPLTLLKYLISKKGRNVPEHAIQDAIWPESDGDMAENAYTTTLHRLRHLLGSRQAVIRSHGLVSLNASFAWTDINAFEACCQKTEKLLSPENAPAVGSDETKGPDKKRGAEEQSRQESLMSALNALIRLYGGPFLPGEEVSWIFASRAHFRIKFSEMLLKAGRVFKRHKHLETAVCFYRQGIDADERLESLYPELMQAYIQLKQNNQALCLFREYQAVFQKESSLSLKMTQLKHQCISS